MNRTQIQIIYIEFIIIGLVLWQYFDKSLTFQSTIFYTILYVFCMTGWFGFEIILAKGLPTHFAKL